MATPEVKFDIEEQQAFDHAFPPATIQAFEEEGVDDWIDIFDALKAFDFPDVQPDKKKLVLSMFSEHRYGPQIHRQETSEGVTKVYRRNISPLIKASIDVFWGAFDYFTDEFKESIKKSTSAPLRNSERDWQGRNTSS